MMPILKNTTYPYDSPRSLNKKHIHHQLLLSFLWWCCLVDVKGDPIAEWLVGVGAIQSILQNPMIKPFEPLHYYVFIMYFHWAIKLPPLICIAFLFDLQRYIQDSMWIDGTPWPHINRAIPSMILKEWAKFLRI